MIGDCFAQQEILADEYPVSPRERPATNAAGYVAIYAFWPCFDFDELIKRIAIRAVEMHCPAFERHRCPLNFLFPKRRVSGLEGHVSVTKVVSKARATW